MTRTVKAPAPLRLTALASLMLELFETEAELEQTTAEEHKAQRTASDAESRLSSVRGRKLTQQRRALATRRAIQAVAERDNAHHTLQIALLGRRGDWRVEHQLERRCIFDEPQIYDQLAARIEPKDEPAEVPA